MKKQYFGILAAVLAGAVTLSGCTGSNSSSDNKQTPAGEPTSTASAVDISKPVKLRMILIGAKPTDTDKVYEKVNAILKEKVNATLEPVFYDWGDWKTKYPLAFASGENFDLIYTANWAFYSEQAAKGGFLELTDQMLKKYAPRTFANVTADQWVQTKLNGKIYMVPYTNKEYGIGKMAIVRGDLREKYNIPKVTDTAGLTRYMETVAEKEKGVLAYNAGGSDGVVWLKRALFDIPNSYGSITIGGQEVPLAIDLKASEAKGTIELIDLFENKAYRNYLEQAKTYRQKGLWSQSALSNKTTNDVSFDNGASATYIRQPLNIAQAFVKNSEAHPDWKLEIVDLYPDIPMYTTSVLSNGMAVHATSGNPERALMVLDLLRHDKQLNDLTTLGIESVHWEAAGDTQYKLLAANSNFAPDSACPWGWRTELYRTNAAYPAQVVNVLNKVQEKGTTPVSSLFTFNSNPVKTEAAAVAAVVAVHRAMLDSGFVDDIDAGLAQYKEKLKSAGYDKLIEEYKAQVAAFVASYGK